MSNISSRTKEHRWSNQNDTWELVPRPKDKNIIGTKWVLRNKMNEQGEVIGKKVRLVCKGYSQ